MGGRLGRPRGTLPSYSDRPLASDRARQEFITRQPDIEKTDNAEAELGTRVPEAFGQNVRMFPDLICPPLIDMTFVSSRRIKRWYCVGRGDYAGRVDVGAYEASQHPYVTTVQLLRPGQTGLPARTWTNFLRAAEGVEVTLETSSLVTVPNPQYSDWSPTFVFDRPGGGATLIFKVDTDPDNWGWVPDLTTHETDLELEVEWTRVENGATGTSTITLTETSGSGSPDGRAKQFNIPAPLPGRLQVRFRIARYHSMGVNNGLERKMTVEVFGQRVIENDVTTFPGFTMLYVEMQGVPADDLQEVLEQPVSVLATRFMRRWDATGIKTGTHLADGISDAVVQMMVDAERAEPEYFDAAAWRSVQDDLNAIDGGEAGRFRMVLQDRMSIEEQLRFMCDHFRLIPHVVGSQLSVRRDQRRDPRTLFAGRQKVEPESWTITHRIPNSFDGVDVEWFDRERDVVRHTFYPPNSPRKNLSVIELEGLGSWSQAWRRAVFEWRKLSARRRELEVTLTEEARWLRPGDRIILADNLSDPGTYADGWGRLNEDAGIQVLVEDPDLDVISTTPGSVIYVRGPSGMEYHVSGASYSSSPPRIIMSAAASFDNPPTRAQQTLPFILGDQFGAAGVEDQLTWVVATVRDNRDGTVDVTCFDYADIYDADILTIPPDPWHHREPIETFETQGDPDP